MSNPYTTPQRNGPQHSSPLNPRGTVMAPAIALIVVASLGLVMSIASIVLALTMDAPPIDPKLPQFLQDAQALQVGPVPAALHSAFLLLNFVILIGAIQMLRLKMWGFALTASILAILNFSNCCCVVGLPVGIWSIVVLSQPQVKKAFE